jgi:hypothetical protein
MLKLNNSVVVVIQSLTQHNVDLICRYIHCQVLYSRYYYLASFFLMLKKLFFLRYNYGTPIKRKRIYTVLRSPFVHKKSREQFEYRLFKRHVNLCCIFNTKFLLSPFNNDIKFLYRYCFRNNDIKIKLKNYYLVNRA